jgi:hypothetical protein
MITLHHDHEAVTIDEPHLNLMRSFQLSTETAYVERIRVT